MAITDQTYHRIALADPDRQWEIDGGRLREKPPMSAEHNDLMFYLGHLLQLQLDRDLYHLRVNAGRLQRTSDRVYIPDVAVIPVALERPMRGRPGTLEVYADPLPLVVEIWSSSTGDYDAAAKLPTYRQRGDLEIWFLHPYDRTLTAWRRQPDGNYTEMRYSNGIVPVAALPGVSIDLDALFA